MTHLPPFGYYISHFGTMEEDEEDDWPLFDARGMRGPNYSPEVASKPSLSPSASACELAAAAASTLGLAGPVVLAMGRNDQERRLSVGVQRPGTYLRRGMWMGDGCVYGRAGARTKAQSQASVCNSYKDPPRPPHPSASDLILIQLSLLSSGPSHPAD